MDSLLNADLHSHSDASDGTLTPEAVAALARAGGVRLWALTDHDTLAGQVRARGAAREQGIDWLAGIEVSVSFIGRTVHVVGLGFDIDDATLVAGVGALRAGRGERAQRIADVLAEAGMPGAFDGALALAGDPAAIARTHFARWLLAQGHVRTLNEAFRRWLGDGRPGAVPHRWASLADAVRWITGAGGIAVVAHPARYRFTPTEEFALLTEFVGHGGRAIEVVTGSHSTAEQARYADVAQEFGLLASRGSDFHAPGESRTDPGALPDLPARLTPVWEALADRVHRAR